MAPFSSSSRRHRVWCLKAQAKRTKLLHIVRTLIPYPPVVIYCNTQQAVERLVEYLHHEQFHVIGAEAPNDADDLDLIRSTFEAGHVDIVVTNHRLFPAAKNTATVVIMYDMPHSMTIYRARNEHHECQSDLHAFVTNQCTIRQELKQFLSSCNQSIPSDL